MTAGGPALAAHAHAAHTRRARAEPLLQASHALLTTLREPDVQRLAADHLQVHLRDSLRRLLRGGEAHEAEALGRALVIADNLGRPKPLALGTSRQPGISTGFLRASPSLHCCTRKPTSITHEG